MMHLISVFMVAIGLSMDAFSLSILYGTLNFTKRKILTLAGCVGAFHFFMPLLGSLIGSFIFKMLPIKPNFFVGIILFLISLEMLISFFKKEELIDLKGFLSMLLFAFTVSIDSFSVGIGLSAFNVNKIIVVLFFSITSLLFTFFGASIGTKLTQKLGKYATLFGSIMLFFLSLTYLFFYNS